MLRMGFIDDVEKILSHAPEEKQTALFSATMPEPIRKITKRYLHDPKQVKNSGKGHHSKHYQTTLLSGQFASQVRGTYSDHGSRAV